MFLKKKMIQASSGEHKTLTNIQVEKLMSEYSPPKDDSEVVVEKVLTSKFGPKKYFCCYCKKSFSKLAKHLERIHKYETDVRNFSILPKGSIERKTIIEKIRKKGGSFLFNKKIQ